MRLTRRRFGIIAAIFVGVLMVMVAAALGDNHSSVSTYSRSPDGYGAWYAFMNQQGTPVKRWQKPFEALADRADSSPATLLRVYSELVPQSLRETERNWVSTGNTLVILGVYQPATEAPFSTSLESSVGQVKIETTRRGTGKELLRDDYGAVVWQETIGKGRVVFSTTPFLAANAYQDRDNYAFLAQIVTKDNHPIWVDEYIHGYRDADVVEETGNNLLSYLAKTPLMAVFFQGVVLLLVVIWAGNRRFGQPIALSAPVTQNSQVYIEALAAVLRKANSTEFVVEAIAKEETRQLQKELGLGETPLGRDALVEAWVKQGGSAHEIELAQSSQCAVPSLSRNVKPHWSPSFLGRNLEALVGQQSRSRRLSETELLSWLDRWRQVRRGNRAREL